MNGDKLAGSLFVEYVEATKGVRSLVFSRGLKKLVGLDDVSDQVLADDIESVESVVFEFANKFFKFKNDENDKLVLGIQFWHLVLMKGSRYDLLEAAKNGGNQGCFNYLKQLIDDNISEFADLPYMKIDDIIPDS